MGVTCWEKSLSCVVKIHAATLSAQRKSQIPASGISEKLYPQQIRLNRDCSSRLAADSALEVIKMCWR